MVGAKKSEKKKTVKTATAAEPESTTEPKKTAKKYSGIRGWSALRAVLKSGKVTKIKAKEIQKAIIKDPDLGHVTLEEYEDIKKDPSAFLSRV